MPYSIEAGASCRLRGHRADTCPLSRLTGITFVVFLTFSQDILIGHGDHLAVQVTDICLPWKDPFIVLSPDVGCSVYIGIQHLSVILKVQAAFYPSSCEGDLLRLAGPISGDIVP